MEERIQSGAIQAQPLPPVKETKLPKIILLVVLGLSVLAGAVFAGIQIGRKQGSLFGGIGTSSLPPEGPEENLVTPTLDPTADWRTYRNEEYGYTIKYPNGWFIYDKGILIAEGGTMSKPFEYVEISPIKVQGTNISTGEFFSKGAFSIVATESLYTKDSFRPEDVKIEEEKINNYLFLELTRNRNKRYFLKTNSTKNFEFNFCDDLEICENSQNIDRDTYTKILSTFRFD